MSWKLGRCLCVLQAQAEETSTMEICTTKLFLCDFGSCSMANKTISFSLVFNDLPPISLVSLQNQYRLPGLTHEISGSFANSTTKNKIFQQVGNEGERHAEKAQHQVADC